MNILEKNSLIDIENIYNQVRNQKCSEKYLAWAVQYIELKTIYCNQILSEDFIRNYILNENYHSSHEDSYITLDHVKKIQERLKNKR